jgi:hypothetical protein
VPRHRAWWMGTCVSGRRSRRGGVGVGQRSIACKNSDERSVRGGGTIARRQPRLEEGGEAKGPSGRRQRSRARPTAVGWPILPRSESRGGRLPTAPFAPIARQRRRIDREARGHRGRAALVSNHEARPASTEARSKKQTRAARPVAALSFATRASQRSSWASAPSWECSSYSCQSSRQGEAPRPERSSDATCHCTRLASTTRPRRVHARHVVSGRAEPGAQRRAPPRVDRRTHTRDEHRHAFGQSHGRR